MRSRSSRATNALSSPGNSPALNPFGRSPPKAHSAGRPGHARQLPSHLLRQAIQENPGLDSAIPTKFRGILRAVYGTTPGPGPVRVCGAPEFLPQGAKAEALRNVGRQPTHGVG